MSKFQFPESRDQLIIMAKVAEQCERFDEMLVCMKRVVKIDANLSNEERNLLSVAYKNVIGSRRACWRAVSSLELKQGNEGQAKLIRAYKKQIEAEIADICESLVGLLESYLIPASPTDEARVYFLKLKGDYHRYHAEADNEDQKEKALEAYSKATEYASSLKATNPIRLGLALNFSVFYFEILKMLDKGCQMARSAFEDALNDPTSVDEDQHKEAALIMQLLRDNLSLWTEGPDGATENDGTKCEELDA